MADIKKMTHRSVTLELPFEEFELLKKLAQRGHQAFLDEEGFGGIDPNAAKSLVKSLVPAPPVNRSAFRACKECGSSVRLRSGKFINHPGAGEQLLCQGSGELPSG